MKGLSIEIIGGVVLALIGVTVMVALFTDISPIDTESGFCGVYNGLSPSLPQAITPSVTGCEEGPDVEYKKISTTDPDRLTLKLAAGIKQCWDKYKGYNVNFKRCKAWSVPSLEGPVDEAMLNTKMKENNICPQFIENSNIPDGPGDVCGSKDQIKFRLSEIEDRSLILVGYNSSTGTSFVEVK
ncbi:MAG: hypothetical protein V5A72_02985 [Candidatus Nanohaloarchaea archaeon]